MYGCRTANRIQNARGYHDAHSAGSPEHHVLQGPAHGRSHSALTRCPKNSTWRRRDSSVRSRSRPSRRAWVRGRSRRRRRPEPTNYWKRASPRQVSSLEPGVLRLRASIAQPAGWNDNLAPRNTVNYYESLVATMGKQADSVVRLFMIPRVGHCGGGLGTDQFNALAALEWWVEGGIAPGRITAQHVTGTRVDLERPLCPYPQVAQWRGIGSTNDAADFECALPAADRGK